MKRLLLILVVITGLFTQCEPEKSVQVQEVKSKELVNSLENDEDFIKLHLASNELSSKTFEKLRALGSNPKRLESQKKLAELFKGEKNEKNFNLIISEFGFTKKEFGELLIEVSTRKNALEKRYGQNFLASINPAEVRQVLSKIEANNASKFRDRIRVCTSCPYNNCSECAEGAETGEIGGGYNNEDEGGGTSSGSAGCNQTCLNGANGKREGLRNLARTALTGALLGCQWGSFTTAANIYESAWILNALGPEAPAVIAAIGGISVDIWCMLVASWTYRNTNMVIEGDYQIDKAGCGC